MSGDRRIRNSVGRGPFGLFAAAATVLFAAGAGLASDPPHWLGASSTTDCTSSCHTLHQAQGGTLTSAAGNVNLCQSCHLAGELPITNDQVALPGMQGTSHAFDVATVHATLGTQDPLNQEMLLRAMDGNIVCSTCHDQHIADGTFGGHARIAEPREVVDAGGSGTLSSGGDFSGANGMWYLVEITQTGSDTGARFRFSKDNAISWTPTDCSPAAPATCLIAGVAVGLDNGVHVSFTGAAADAFQTGERWEFSAAWPFLRTALDEGDNAAGDSFCRDCHRSWVMTHTEVQTWDGGFKSHPVGVILNANSQDYDRTEPLDGDGLPQNGSGPSDVDGNPSNDLWLDSTGNVQCLSCHGVHYADSNTLTGKSR